MWIAVVIFFCSGTDKFFDLVRAKEKTKGELVFMSNGSSLDPDNFYKRNFQKDIEASGVERIRFHDLRHTFASHYMMSGGNLYDLQKILGHADIKTTERYAHLSLDYLAGRKNLVSFSEGDNVVEIDFKRAVAER
jgi:site-specific recombinase XerC